MPSSYTNYDDKRDTGKERLAEVRARRRRQVCTRGESSHGDAIRIDAEPIRIGAHPADDRFGDSAPSEEVALVSEYGRPGPPIVPRGSAITDKSKAALNG